MSDLLLQLGLLGARRIATSAGPDERLRHPQRLDAFPDRLNRFWCWWVLHLSEQDRRLAVPQVPLEVLLI